MSETSHGGPGNTVPGQLPPFEGSPDNEAPGTSWEAAEELRAAHRGWLERRGIDPETTPQITMRSQEELDMFRNAPSNYQGYVKKIFKIPEDKDQLNVQYALVDIAPDDPNLPPRPTLMVLAESDFGTTIDREVIDMDFQTPDDPNNPNLTGGALKTVNIAETLAESTQGLRTFAAELMEDKTTDPLSSHYGDIGVRAGEPAPGQKDAYIWTVSPFAKSVELTLAFPSQYNSVCVVRGQRREAGNGKVGMAQIDNPEVALKIEGENLRRLQNVYQSLYYRPDFALTEEQRLGRDELFNDYLAQQISNEARSNLKREQAREEEEYHRRQRPQLRAREIPRS